MALFAASAGSGVRNLVLDSADNGQTDRLFVLSSLLNMHALIAKTASTSPVGRDLVPVRQLKTIGWAKNLELPILARRDGKSFSCATGCTKRGTCQAQLSRPSGKGIDGRRPRASRDRHFQTLDSQRASVRPRHRQPRSKSRYTDGTAARGST